jgi:hypothetical protein
LAALQCRLSAPELPEPAVSSMAALMLDCSCEIANSDFNNGSGFTRMKIW